MERGAGILILYSYSAVSFIFYNLHDKTMDMCLCIKVFDVLRMDRNLHGHRAVRAVFDVDADSLQTAISLLVCRCHWNLYCFTDC